MADWWLLIIAALLGLYGLACSLECAVALRILASDKAAKATYSPWWEANSLLGAAGFALAAIVFHPALQPLWHTLFGTLALAIFALLARGGLGFALATSGKASPRQSVLFAAANLAVPLTLVAAGIYLITGQYFWQTAVGWTLFIATPLGLSAVGLMLLAKYLHKPEPAIVEQTYLLWLVALGSALPLAVKHSTSLLQTAPMQLITLTSLLGICLVFLKYTYGWRRTWLIGPLLLLATPILLAWANRPYLVSGQLTLDQAHGVQAFSTALLIGGAILLPLAAIGFWVFRKILSDSSSSK